MFSHGRARNAGHGNPGKSWNLSVDYGKSWKMILIVRNKLDTFLFLYRKWEKVVNNHENFENFQENGQI